MKRNLERRIGQAYSRLTPPNVLDDVASACAETPQERQVTQSKPPITLWRRIAAMAAALVLLAGVGIGVASFVTSRAVESTVSLDVNPSIELALTRSERVASVTTNNEDAAIVLGDMDLTGSSLEVALNALIGSMLRQGYITDTANSILVTVNSSDPARGEQLEHKLAQEISVLLQTESFHGAVLSQTLGEDDALRRQAEEYGITQGKAQLIREIMALDARYTFETLASLSIHELNLIYTTAPLPSEVPAGPVNTVGNASDKAYIGEEAAKTAAFARAGVAQSDVSHCRVEFDYEHGVMVYEVEFYALGMEYSVDINAATGAVVDFEQERDDDRPAGTTSGTGTGIGEAAATAAALSHAGLSAESVSGLTCKQDWDDGVSVYDVDFYSGGYEYSYTIDAASGAVVDYEREWDDDRPANTTTSGNGTNTGTGTTIGESAATTAALSHAGLGAGSVSGLKCELDRDDGATVYEVEFHSGGYDYEYTIDAVSGAVLWSEKEWDD